MLNAKYHVKRGLHRVLKKRFLPSPDYCSRCKKHVLKDHEAKTGHRVFHMGAILQKHPPEAYKFGRRYNARLKVPAVIDYREMLEKGGFKILNQGMQGSCTAFAGAYNKQGQEIVTGTSPGRFSQAFLYYMERLRNGRETEDSGANMTDIVAVLSENGICLNSTMPYNENDYTTPPSDAAKKEALLWTSDRDHTSLSWDEVRPALAEGPVMKNGVPIGFPMVGIPIYKSFLNSEFNSGYVPIPKKNEELLGYHALYAIGADTIRVSPDGTKGFYQMAGSWGAIGFDRGYHWIPLGYETRTGPMSDNVVQFDSVPGPGPGPKPPDNDCIGNWNKSPKDLSAIIALLLCLLGVKASATELAVIKTAIKELAKK